MYSNPSIFTEEPNPVSETAKNLPPYVIKELTTSSGNHARLKVFFRHDGTVIDMTWDHGHTRKDEEEAAIFATQLIQERFPETHAVAAYNLTENDDKKREDLLARILIPGYGERN